MPRGSAGGQVMPMTTSNMPKLQVSPRSATGKGGARRLRETGLVPAVAYGKGMPATPIAVTPKEVAVILKSELGRNTVIELQLQPPVLAMIREYTLHPVKRHLEHVDFVEVKLDRP